MVQHDDERQEAVGHELEAEIVADDGVLGLEIAVQPEPQAGEVLPDHRHAQIGPVPAAVLGRERIPVMPGRVGTPLRLMQQFLPLPARQAAPVPVGPGILTPVVEETDVVILLLQRPDLGLDELVELGQVAGQVGRDVEVHVRSLPRQAAPLLEQAGTRG